MKKTSKKEIVEDIDFTLNRIDFLKPMSEELVLKCLSIRDLRNEFILNYSYFDSDGNSAMLVKWAKENLKSHNNELLESIFDLSVNINLFNINLLGKAEEIVNGRFYELTKLAVLDWFLINKIKIGASKFNQLNSTAYRKTTLSLVKLQAAINLTLQDDEHASKVKTILKGERYPTAFYRVINSFDYMADRKRKLFINLIRDSFHTTLSNSIVADLELKINSYK